MLITLIIPIYVCGKKLVEFGKSGGIILEVMGTPYIGKSRPVFGILYRTPKAYKAV
jgi:hypothetical protein